MTKLRFATVKGRRPQIEPYLPSNYGIEAVIYHDDETPTSLIVGQDRNGWTLEWLIERLASGLHFATELTPKEPS